jgi:hypothetical protein
MAQRLLRSVAALDFRVCAALAALAAFVVYLRTLAPTVMWYDMGELTTASYVLGIAHNTGYPLYILLGKLFTLFPIGDVAYRVNLMSAVFASLTVALVFLIIAELTRNRAAALIGALTVAFSSTLWASANWAESYPLNAFSTALITWLLLRWRTTGQVWYVRLALLAFGLSIGNHRLIVLLAPGILLFLWAARGRLSIGHWLQLALLFLLGLSVYLYLPIRGSQGPSLNWAQPANLSTYWHMFLTGDSGSEHWNFAFLGRLNILALFPLHEVTAFGLILAAIGLVSALKRDRLFAAYSLLLCASIGLLVLTYMIHNVFNYFIPAYLMVGVWIGYGVDAILSFVTRQAGLGAFQLSAVRPGLRWSLAALVLASLPVVLFARSLPAVDRSHDYSAYDFARTTLERVEPNSTIVADTWAASPLWYVQLVEGYRRDVFVSPALSVPGEDVGAFVARQFEKGRPVYVAAGLLDNLDAIQGEYYVQPVVLDGIETMLTNVLPKPEYKDDLVPRGSVYRVLQDRPTLSVADVPPPAQVDMAFGDAVSLVGFLTDPQVAKRGDVLEVSYYWRLESPAEGHLQATVFFTDQDETLQVRYGFPLWWQSHELGGGLYPTSQWGVGEIVKEDYYVLVPRNIEPGLYYMRMRVQKGTLDLTTSAAENEAAGSALLVDDVLLVE